MEDKESDGQHDEEIGDVEEAVEGNDGEQRILTDNREPILGFSKVGHGYQFIIQTGTRDKPTYDLRSGSEIGWTSYGFRTFGALAGVALSAAGKFTEATDAEYFDQPDAEEGAIERVILAEAAFAAIRTMNLPPGEEEIIFSDIKDYVMKTVPAIKKVAPRVMGAMMQPALRIALDSLHKHNQKGLSGAEAFGNQNG
ncbi:MAG: hypothetical protein Q9166_007603 [cf. Caloplaca sp. 2 TL-2023]